MGLFLKQNEQRSQLQTKIAADLSERLASKPLQQTETPPVFLDNQKHTTSLAWVWIAIIAAVIAIFIAWVITNQQAVATPSIGSL